MSCDCCVVIPLSAMGLAAVFDCDTHLLILGAIHADSDGFGESAHLLGLVWAFVTVQNSHVVTQMAIECHFVWAAKDLASLQFIYVSWSTSELRVRLAPLNRFKPSSKIFYWPFQGGTSFVDLLCFCSVLCLLCFVRVCLYVLCGHLLGKGWPLGSRLWCLLWVCHFPIGILGQVWYLIVSIPDLCTITYFYLSLGHCTKSLVLP